jgi:Flp pilus assembly protein protease CpaA
MKNIGFVITALSLVIIAYSDFKRKLIYNLSLVSLIAGLGIFLPSANWVVSTVQILVTGLSLILINSLLEKKSKTKIQAGDLKLILVLAWFFTIQNLLIIMLISSTAGLSLSLRLKQIPLGGLLALTSIAIICVKLSIIW